MRTLLLTLSLLAVPALVQAQTGPCPTFPQSQFQANPTRGCFNPDMSGARGAHNGADPVTGVSDVARYDILYFAESADVATATPLQAAASIGKPTPVQGAIWYGQGTAVPLPAYPLGQRVKAVVVAVGPTGLSSPRGAANTSNPFGQSGPATAPLAPTGLRLSGE